MTHRDHKTNLSVKNSRSATSRGRANTAARKARPTPSYDPRVLAARSNSAIPDEDAEALALSLKIDASLLNFLKSTLDSTLTSPFLVNDVQKIKSLLYEKDFLSVFSNEKLLMTYVARWVPSRTLAFREMMGENQYVQRALCGRVARDGRAVENDEQSEKEKERRRARKVVVVGGGAASELLAIFGIIAQVHGPFGSQEEGQDQNASGSGQGDADSDVEAEGVTKKLAVLDLATPTPAPAPGHVLNLSTPTDLDLDIELVDIGPYNAVVDLFEQNLREQYPFLFADSGSDEQRGVKVQFHQLDVLRAPGAIKTPEPRVDASSSEPTPAPAPEANADADADANANANDRSLESLLSLSHLNPGSLATPPPIITLLFTLTELFIQSRPQTILFLRRLTLMAPKGTLLLVADSANEAASALNVGKEGRNYSMGTVLDGLFCSVLPGAAAAVKEEQGEGEGDEAKPQRKPKANWECLESSDSKWFRLRDGLQENYPIKMENTRYWMRLYRKL